MDVKHHLHVWRHCCLWDPISPPVVRLLFRMGNLVAELVSPKHLFLNQVSSFYPNCHLLLYHTIVICACSGVCVFPLPKMLLWLILGVWKWGQKGDGQIVDNLWTTMCQKRHWVPGPAHLIMYQFSCSLVTARCIFYSASQKVDMMRMNV